MNKTRFGKLLTQGIRAIAINQGKTITEVETQIAHSLNYSLDGIRYWRRGNIPPNNKHVEWLVHKCVLQGMLNQAWAAEFLECADYAQSDTLLQELFLPDAQEKLDIPTVNVANPNYKQHNVKLSNKNHFIRASRRQYITSQDIKMALRAVGDTNQSLGSIMNLYLFQRTWFQKHNNPVEVANTILLEGIQTLRQTYKQDADLLEKRFIERKEIKQLATFFNLSETSIYAKQRKAIERLTEIINIQERTARTERERELDSRLMPSTYANLLGADIHIDKLKEVVLRAEPPHLILIEGIGGIGKTALLDAFIREVVAEGTYHEIGWFSPFPNHTINKADAESTRQKVITQEYLIHQLAYQLMPDPDLLANISYAQIFKSFHNHITNVPHLIVIDNIETFPDMENLFPVLKELSNPTKFLLGSRINFYSFPSIYHFRTIELSKDNSIELIRREAELSNIPELVACKDAELLPIYDYLGGNPLALKLIVGQIRLHTINTVLDNLRNIRTSMIKNLFIFIYNRAWNSLDNTSKHVLSSIISTNEAVDSIDVLMKISNLELEETYHALSRLIEFNLVYTQGNIQERVYKISNLTRTFLQNQVIS
ncbi:MAG: NB-ARC domain-containing protein [Chloroflexota bacterium]